VEETESIGRSMTEHHKHLRVHEAASVQPRRNHRRPEVLQGGASVVHVAQWLRTVAIAGVCVQARGRREPTVARNGESALPAGVGKWVPGKIGARSASSPLETGDIRTPIWCMVIVVGTLVCNCPLHGLR
jgi:hypothetical protein